MAITKRQATELAKQTFEYAPAPEATDHISIKSSYGLFVGGKMLISHYYQIPTELALGLVAVILLSSVAASLWKPKARNHEGH